MAPSIISACLHVGRRPQVAKVTRLGGSTSGLHDVPWDGGVSRLHVNAGYFLHHLSCLPDLSRAPHLQAHRPEDSPNPIFRPTLEIRFNVGLRGWGGGGGEWGHPKSYTDPFFLQLLQATFNVLVESFNYSFCFSQPRVIISSKILLYYDLFGGVILGYLGGVP